MFIYITLLFFTLFISLFILKSNNQKRLNELKQSYKEKINRSKSFLQSMMNPHLFLVLKLAFLFNSNLMTQIMLKLILDALQS